MASYLQNFALQNIVSRKHTANGNRQCCILVFQNHVFQVRWKLNSWEYRENFILSGIQQNVKFESYVQLRFPAPSL